MQNPKKCLARCGSLMLLIFLLVPITILSGCAGTPDNVRRYGRAREMQFISAKRPLIAACISTQLKKTTTDEIDERPDSVMLVSKGETLRIYDLEDWVGGTMVVIYGDINSFFVSKDVQSVVDACRRQLEPLKPMVSPGE